VTKLNKFLAVIKHDKFANIAPTELRLKVEKLLDVFSHLPFVFLTEAGNNQQVFGKHVTEQQKIDFRLLQKKNKKKLEIDEL
jgi:hypothetical protein